MFNELPTVTIALILLYLGLFIFDALIFKRKLFEWGCAKSFNNMQKKEECVNFSVSRAEKC